MKLRNMLCLVVTLVMVVLLGVCIPTVCASDLDETEIRKSSGAINQPTPIQVTESAEGGVRGFTKEGVRREFAIVADGGRALGLSTAAAFLDHSLQDNPSNLIYGASSSYAIQILNSAECAALVREFRESVTGEELLTKNKSGSLTLNSTRDLHLAYNKVSYVARGVNNNGRWTLTITISDRYDFEEQKWKNSMTDNNLVTIINNYAAYAQDIGAIVPYNIKVTVQTTFTEYQLDNIGDDVLYSEYI